MPASALTPACRTFRGSAGFWKACPALALARPNMVMFGDWNYQHRRTEAQRQSQERWIDVIQRNSGRIVIVEIGAGQGLNTAHRCCPLAGPSASTQVINTLVLRHF